MRVTKSLTSAIFVAKRLSRHLMDVMRYGRGMTLTNGNALAGRLAKSAFDLNIPLWLSSPVRELIVEDGAVRGAVVEREGRLVRVHAKRGVILACGGFPHDVARRKAMFPHAPDGTQHYSPGPAGNTGDGLRLAEAVGGRVEDTLPNAAAWVPVSVTTRKDGSKRRDAAFHRSRQTRRDRRDARRRALRQRGQFLSRLRPGDDEGRQARRRDRRLPDLRSQDPAQIWPRLRAAVSDADRPSRQDRLSDAWRYAGGTGRSGRHRCARAGGDDCTIQRVGARPDRIPPSARDRAPTTAFRAMRCTDRTPASPRSNMGRSTRSRW